MPQEPHNPDEATSQRDEEQPQQRRRIPGQSWSSLVDERIRAALEQGQFDHLASAGKPLDLDENPYAGDRRLEFHILKSHDAAPREIELGGEVDAELARAEAVLAELRRKRAVLMRQRLTAPRRASAINRLQRAYLARYEASLRAARDRTLSLNVIAPAAFHRPHLDITARLQAFHEEFPTLAEE